MATTSLALASLSQICSDLFEMSCLLMTIFARNCQTSKLIQETIAQDIFVGHFQETLKPSSSCSCDAHRSSTKIGVVHSRGRQGLQQPHHQHYIDLHSRQISMGIPMFPSPSIRTLGSKKHECLSTNNRSLLYKYSWRFLVIFRERNRQELINLDVDL
jgi:hypothetical protein